MLPSVFQAVQEHFDTASITAQLRSDPDNKLTLWSQLKTASKCTAALELHQVAHAFNVSMKFTKTMLLIPYFRVILTQIIVNIVMCSPVF